MEEIKYYNFSEEILELRVFDGYEKIQKLYKIGLLPSNRIKARLNKINGYYLFRWHNIYFRIEDEHDNIIDSVCIERDIDDELWNILI